MSEYKVGTIGGENTAAVTVEILCRNNPNHKFEAIENGSGHYEVWVWSKLGNTISWRTLKSFSNSMVNTMLIVSQTISILGDKNMINFSGR